MSPRRTLVEARSVLESTILPRVNDFWAQAYRRVLDDAEAEAKATATEHADRQAKALSAGIRDQQRELTEVRDGYEMLTADADSFSAAEYARRLHALRDRERKATAALAKLEERVASVADVEERPIEFVDRITPPIAQREWPW